MNLLLTLLGLTLVAGGGYVAWSLRNSSSPLLAKRAPQSEDPQPQRPPLIVVPQDPSVIDPIIAGPPLVPSVTGHHATVGEHLKHFSWQNYSWDETVFEVYRRVLNRPHLASYFHDVKDLNALQRHFTHALKIVTMDGLSARTDIRTAEVHRRIRDRNGRPITGEVYDEVAAILAAVLAEKGVPQAGVDSLAPVLAQLRTAIEAEGL